MDTLSNEPSENEIAELAQKLWEDEGRPEGKAGEHWARAQEQLRGGTAGENPEADFEKV